MKNTIILLLIIASFIFINNYFNGCKDSGTNPVLPQCLADTSITITDRFGNILGGDTSDWCQHDSGGVKFYPAYPNPCLGSFTARIYEPSTDTVMLYFLKTCTDTTVLFKAVCNNSGSYEFQIHDSTNQYVNTYQRLYFKSHHYSSSANCRFYGDIKFTE